MLQVGQVRLPRQLGPRALGLGHAVARDQAVTQLQQHLGEIQIAGGLGNQQVKAPVGFDAAVAGSGQVLIVIQRLAHARQMPLVTTQCGQRGSLALKANTQLQQIAHIRRALRRNAQAGLGLAFHHERTDPVARLHQPRGLQLRQGFANHRAADPVLAHQGVFRRQFVAWFEGAQ